jgi:uncharacterized protein (DUF1778 family)
MSDKRTTKTKRITFRLLPADEAALRRLAKRQRTTRSRLLQAIVQRVVRGEVAA